MILEKSKGNNTIYSLPKAVKSSKKLMKELLEKIIQKKKEPFSNVVVFIFPTIFPDFIKELNKNNIKIKNILADRTKIGIEL